MLTSSRDLETSIPEVPGEDFLFARIPELALLMLVVSHKDDLDFFPGKRLSLRGSVTRIINETKMSFIQLQTGEDL